MHTELMIYSSRNYKLDDFNDCANIIQLIGLKIAKLQDALNNNQ